jgi:hypothetical protein
MFGDNSTVKCPDCDASAPLFIGEGKCPKCFGTGTNTALNSPEPKCRNCDGTGVCPTCQGRGLVAKPRLGWPRLALISGVAILFGSIAYCGYAQRKYVPIATRAISVFHHRFSAAQDDLIFFEADPAWSRALDAETERKFFTRIRRKMGSCSYTGASGWTVNATPSGTLITISYQAFCNRGP